ncbi:unnamed protein product [Linum tenue]|uniref:Uncharacterized protein n=1 Tax=Linum tenue TaxID=586396 RepID=A0AAV0QA43_9ROSI|nr:unnamed protein product [Linum tenue]
MKESSLTFHLSSEAMNLSRFSIFAWGQISSLQTLGGFQKIMCTNRDCLWLMNELAGRL